MLLLIGFIVKEIKCINGKYYLLGEWGILLVECGKIIFVCICDNMLVLKGKKFSSFCIVKEIIYGLIEEINGKNWIFGFYIDIYF